MLSYLDNAGRLPIKIVVVKKILGNAIKEILTTKKTLFPQKVVIVFMDRF